MVRTLGVVDVAHLLPRKLVPFVVSFQRPSLPIVRYDDTKVLVPIILPNQIAYSLNFPVILKGDECHLDSAPACAYNVCSRTFQLVPTFSSF